MHELTLNATVENIAAVTDFVNEKLEGFGCSPQVQMQIDIAIDELFGNIAQYAYNPDVGPATVCVEIEEEPLTVIITMIDHGAPFDPLKREEPDVTRPADERGIGGLGIFMAKKLMDGIDYRYENGRNILSIRKKM